MACHDQDGFTLVEVMAVVVILGILAAIAVASFVSSSSMAETVACRSNQRILAQAALEYRLDHDGSDPSDLSDMEDYVKSYDNCSRCPADGRPLAYDASTDSVRCTYPGHD